MTTQADSGVGAGTPALEFEIFTLFPDAVAAFLRAGLIGKALEDGRVRVHCTSPRAYTHDRHRTVDDTPYGGGPGMLLKIDPLVAALEAVEAARGPAHRVLLTPSAPRLTQAIAQRLSQRPRIALFCGRYEGIDARLREHYIDESLSLGDFVLNGGEVAALVVVEAVARLVEGVIGNPESLTRESFSSGPDTASAARSGLWLEAPQYTRPVEFRGLRVPEVLVRGNHADIDRWRQHTAWARTWRERPELRQRVSRPTRPVYLALAAVPQVDDRTQAFVDALLARLERGGAGLVLLGKEVCAWWRDAVRGRDGIWGVTVDEAPTPRALRRALRQRHGRRPELAWLQEASASGEIARVTPDGDAETRSAVALEDLLELRDLGSEDPKNEEQDEERRELRPSPLVLVLACRQASGPPRTPQTLAFNADLRFLVAPGAAASTTTADLTGQGVAQTLEINESSQPLPGPGPTLELVSTALSSLRALSDSAPNAV